jgi:ABC-type molybdate transport system permease subunit
MEMYQTFAAADLATTLGGIAFWGVLLAAYVGLFVATVVSVRRSSLDARARTKWIWFLVLAPGAGIVMWFAAGRRAVTG